MNSLVVGLIVAGVMVGTLYGLVGVSLTLMLRSSGVLSFAHAGFALISAYTYNGLVCKKGTSEYVQCLPQGYLPPVAAAMVSVLAAVVAALVTERLVARPLQRSGLAAKVIATAAVLSLVSGLLLQKYGAQPRFTPPDKQFLPTGGFTFLGVVISWQRFTIFIASILLVLLLTLLLRTSRFGLGLRAAGQLPDVARLMGINPVATSRFNWALGGLLSGLAGVLIGPVTSVNIVTFSFLLLKAVGATLIGGLISLPLTFVGGVGLGVVEAVLPHYWRSQGASQVGIAAFIVLFVLLHRHRFTSIGDSGQGVAATAGPLARVLARGLVRLSDVRTVVPRGVWAMLGVGILTLPLVNDYYASVANAGLYYGLLALSVLVITGPTGEVSFMQAGFVAIGAFGFATAVGQGWGVLPSVVVTMVVAACFGALAGSVSLRFRGLEFAIVSIALSAVMSEYVVSRGFVKTAISDTGFLGLSLVKARDLYGFMLVLSIVVVVLVANLRRSAWYRALTAVRELGIRIGHFGLNSLRSEVILLSFSAAIASLAGMLLAMTILTGLDPFLFTPLLSIVIVLTGVVGGLRTLWGPVMAGLLFGPGQELLGRVFSQESANAFPQIAGALLALLVVMKMPDGLASAFQWARTVVMTAPRPTRYIFRGFTFPEPTTDGSPAPPSRLARGVHGETRARTYAYDTDTSAHHFAADGPTNTSTRHTTRLGEDGS